MKTLYIDCGMGAAGDMLTAALYELLDDSEKENFIKEMNSIGIKDVVFEAEKSVKCGITGTHMKVTVKGKEEGTHHHEQEETHKHEHSHEHTHEHHHSHSSMSDIKKAFDELKISDNVKEKALSIYNLIAQAESEVHGVPVTEIHFHEVGAKDAIADVTAVCVLMEKLGVDKVIVSPVHVGAGKVHCAHGILPVPAPATASILKDVPIYGGKIQGELCTPTGAAILKTFANSFGEMPIMSVKKIGYGMGKKDFEAANCVRVMLGENEGMQDEILEFTCNLDDMSAEKIGFAMEELFKAGAAEVYTLNAGMKKNRPGHLLCVMCKESLKDEILHLIFKHTTTIGIRQNISIRHILTRRIETISTEFGDVRVKISEGYGVKKQKLEYDDLSKIARENNLSIVEVEKRIEL